VIPGSGYPGEPRKVGHGEVDRRQHLSGRPATGVDERRLLARTSSRPGVEMFLEKNRVNDFRDQVLCKGQFVRGWQMPGKALQR